MRTSLFNRLYHILYLLHPHCIVHMAQLVNVSWGWGVGLGEGCLTQAAFLSSSVSCAT
jgi:hypothetical protein